MRIIGCTLTWFLVNVMKLVSTIMVYLEKIHKLQRRYWGLLPPRLILPTASPENLPQAVQKWFTTNCCFLFFPCRSID